MSQGAHRYRPETFGIFSLELFVFGVQRHLPGRKKAPILQGFRDGGAGREDSNLRMVESKSD
jgi:hypothetical protein